MAQKKARGKTGLKNKRAGRGAGEIERYEKALEGLEKWLKALPFKFGDGGHGCLPSAL
jgi:hypothetical protein